jgi:16S rRNA processing protein RimM
MQQTLGSFFIESSSRTKNDFLRIRFEDMNTEDADAVIGNDYIFH